MDDRSRFLARKKLLEQMASEQNSPELAELANEPMDRKVAGTEINKEQRDASIKVLEEMLKQNPSPMIEAALADALARNPKADKYEKELEKQKELEAMLEARLAEFDKIPERPTNPNIGDVTGKNKKRR